MSLFGHNIDWQHVEWQQAIAAIEELFSGALHERHPNLVGMMPVAIPVFDDAGHRQIQIGPRFVFIHFYLASYDFDHKYG